MITNPSSSAEVASQAQRPSRPVHSCTPKMLGIEDAYRSPTSDALGQPEYVNRTHDSRLRAQVARARSGTSTIITLLSSGTAGKKRSAWEAIRDDEHGLPRWELWPLFYPATPEQIFAVLPDIPPFSVLWLPQIERYFPNLDRDRDEQLALTLRTLLHDESRTPVLLLFTATTQYWRALISPDKLSDRSASGHVRALLKDSDVRVADSLGSLELSQARQSADVSVADAAQRARDGRVVQYLVTGPQLRTRYTSSSQRERMVLDAIVDMRRLGHSPWISEPLLKHAVGCVAVDEAVTKLLAPVAGGSSLLEKRTTIGKSGDSVVEYRLHDWVESHGIRNQATSTFRQEVLDALAQHADPASRASLSVECEARGLLREAVGFALQDVDERTGWRRAGSILQAASWTDDALACYRHSARKGDDEALTLMLRLCKAAKRLHDLVAWLTPLATANRPFARSILGHAHAALGAHAIDAYKKAALDDDDNAMVIAAALMAEQHRLDEALSWLVSLAGQDRPQALRHAAELSLEYRGLEATLTWLHALGQDGVHAAFLAGARLLLNDDNTNDALAWCTTAVDFGLGAPAYVMGTEVLLGARMTDRAHGWALKAADAGTPAAVTLVGESYARVKMDELAFEAFREAIEHGHKPAYTAGVELAARRGALADLRGWYDQAVRHSVAPTPARIAELLIGNGFHQEAIDFVFDTTDATDPACLVPVVPSLVSLDRVHLALDRLTTATGWSRGYAECRLAEMLATSREEAAAAALFRSAAESGYLPAYAKGGRLLLEAKRPLLAIELLTSGAAVSAPDVRSPLAIAYAATRQYDRALAIIEDQLGKHDPGATAPVLKEWIKSVSKLPFHTPKRSFFPEPPNQSRSDERRPGKPDDKNLSRAIALLRRAVDLNDPDSLPVLAELLTLSNKYQEAQELYLKALLCRCTHARKHLDSFADHGYLISAAHLKQYGINGAGELAECWMLHDFPEAQGILDDR